MDTDILAIIISVLLALFGYFITYWNNLMLSQRKERLERVNRQLSEFYGPLYSLICTSNITWRAFREKYPLDGSFWSGLEPPTDEEAVAWRLWMEVVFMPLNLQMQDLIINKSALFIEPEMPECLLKLSAHVSAYKAVLKQWQLGDFSMHTTGLNFPGGEIYEYAKKSYQKLKLEQNSLLDRQQIASKL